jgi:ORF6N domain
MVMPTSSPVPTERIERAIFLVRGHKVMLDADLAVLYRVDKVLNQAVKRNSERFRGDFMFRLTTEEAARLRSQTVTLKVGRGQHRKYLPYVFTEHGVAMLSSVLRSRRAVLVNIEIMRAFVRLRQIPSISRGPGPKARRPREEVRHPVQGSVRRHPRTDDAAGSYSSPDRLPRQFMRRTDLGTHFTAEWTTLREQQAKAAKREAAIATNLKELGYGG